MEHVNSATHLAPWNKAKLVGQKAPFKLKEIWAIRVRLQLSERARELALFDRFWCKSSDRLACTIR
jgi:hypothetical protein